MTGKTKTRYERDTLKLAVQEAEGVLLEFTRQHEANAYIAAEKTLSILDAALAQTEDSE